jgi:hydroxymethylpyrimidine/phosphomethylpyrimidine kinase
VALSVAGSDPSAGAGIQADVRVFALHGVAGAAVLTSITVQGPVGGVRRVQVLEPGLVAEQLATVLSELPVAAAKTGMLGNGAAVRAVVETWDRLGGARPLVVDPVFVSSSGARLLDDEGITVLRAELLPRATVITPNLDEAAILLRMERVTADEAPDAAAAIGRLGAPVVVVKGGHAKGRERATDFVWMASGPGGKPLTFGLSAPWVDTGNRHGTGCLFSSAIVAALTLGAPIRGALEHARRTVQRGLEAGREAGSHNGAVWLDRVPRERW